MLYNGILEIQDKVQTDLLTDAAEELNIDPLCRSCPDSKKVSVMAATQVLQDYLAQKLYLSAPAKCVSEASGEEDNDNTLNQD